MKEFINILCENLKLFQRYNNGKYQIEPTDSQKQFLYKIITGKENFHFSEVGSGKTKVILPLLCQAFLSNNTETHLNLSKGGSTKNTLIVLVPEHLINDAKAQVFRYCLALNFRKDYKI